MNTTWVHITSGEGPGECERAARFVLDELLREAAAAGLTATALDAVTDGKERLQSALLAIEGDGLEDFLAGWIGTVQWVCRSSERPTHKRKNWFVGVERLTTPEEKSWSMDEVRIDVMRASGPGGQHVNKTESAVRVTHVQTGFVAVAREERSQHRNKALALARLAELIAANNRRAKQQATAARREQHRGLVRGNAIRTYEGLDFKRKAD
jgi:peptide chain release factor